MDESPEETLTRILREAEASGTQPADELLPEVYDELRRLARGRLAQERAGQTLQATALVHEAYMRLVGDADPGWNGRGHFFGAAARAMRRILVERARRRDRDKRGGGLRRVGLEGVDAAVELDGPSLLAVDEALAKLEARDPRKGRLVELRYFAGLNAEESAQALGISLATVERDWRFIKAWLREELEGGDS